MRLNPGNAIWYARLFLVACVCTLCGSALFCHAVWESYASRGWPHAPGTIVASYTERTCGGIKAIHRWEGKILYRYRVADVPYEGYRLGSKKIYCSSDRGEIQEWLRSHYPPGKVVDVYYRPSGPGSAFLDPGRIDAGDVVMIFVLMAMSGLMLVGARLSLQIHARRGLLPPH